MAAEVYNHYSNPHIFFAAIKEPAMNFVSLFSLNLQENCCLLK